MATMRPSDLSLRRDRASWEALARRDPYWAICTISPRPVSVGPEEFFASGERDVVSSLGLAEAAGLTVVRGRVLDFGCGVDD